MDDDRTLDRRSFLGSASAAGLVGFAGLGSLRSRARQDGNGGLVGNQDGNGGEGNQTGGGQGDGGEGDEIDFFRAVIPSSDVLKPSLVNKIVVVGGPIQPGTRPPPLCFPQDVDQWRARDAVVVKPTETTGFFGGGDSLGAVQRTRAHLEYPVEPGTVYRVAGGEFCDGYARVTVHELPPRLSEYFSTEMLDQLDESLRGVGNATAGNGTATNGTVEDRG